MCFVVDDDDHYSCARVTCAHFLQLSRNTIRPTVPFYNCSIPENPPYGPAANTPVCTVTGASLNALTKLTYSLNADAASLNLPVRTSFRTVYPLELFPVLVPYTMQFPFIITTLNNSNPNDIQSAIVSTYAYDALANNPAAIVYSPGGKNAFKVFYGVITATDEAGFTGYGQIQVLIRVGMFSLLVCGIAHFIVFLRLHYI